MKNSLLFLAFLFVTVDSVACFTPPKEQLVTADQLLAKSTNVSLAKVVKAEVAPSGQITYYFEVVTRFAGPKKNTFQVLGVPSIWEGTNRTFENHTESSFWETRVGRLSNDSDCKIYPEFSVGGHYLVFLDQPYTNKSFELIIHTHGNKDVKDKWLQYVETHFLP